MIANNTLHWRSCTFNVRSMHVLFTINLRSLCSSHVVVMLQLNILSVLACNVCVCFYFCFLSLFIVFIIIAYSLRTFSVWNKTWLIDWLSRLWLRWCWSSAGVSYRTSAYTTSQERRFLPSRESGLSGHCLYWVDVDKDFTPAVAKSALKTFDWARLRWRRGVVVGLDQHRARLLFGWVTGCWQVNHFGMHSTTRSTQPSIPPG